MEIYLTIFFLSIILGYFGSIAYGMLRYKSKLKILPQREICIKLFEAAHKTPPFATNIWHEELMKIQAKCRHENWVYSPDREKRICGECCLRQRAHEVENRLSGKYFNSSWVAPPLEPDRYNLRKIFDKWENQQP